MIITFASLSKLANKSLSMFTSSLAVSCEPRVVKPQMSANKILQQGQSSSIVGIFLPCQYGNMTRASDYDTII